MQKKYRRMLIMLAYILVVSSTIAYSALTSSLQLNAEAKLRTISDIRVTGISLSSANGGTLQYESSYDVNTITSGFVLPTTDSSITYKVTVTNNGTIDQTIYDILTQSSNNSGLYYEISGYNVRDVIGFKTVVEFYITYKTTTPSEEPINVVNKFNFKKVYHVTFEAKGGTSITDGIKYEGVDLSLSTFTSTKQGYILSGWTDEQDGTTVKYQTNGTYTLDRDLILYAVWEPNPNTSYSVNHYVHDLGTNTYTLDSTDNLTGTTDSTLTLASLKKTIPGFTYVDGYLTGGTTKPTSGAVTTTTILADGSRVINLYYRRNYLYVQYDMNGGSQFSTHGESWGTSGSLVTYTGNTISTNFLRGVYDSKVGSVNTNTYVINTSGLDNYNYSNGMNVYKDGYKGKSYLQWNTSSDGTGTSYYQDGSDYDANDFGGVDLSTGDQVVTLYVNWVPVNYEIQYDLQGGTVSTANPASYNIETNTFTLNNPTLTGYTFTGWTGSNGNTPQTTVTIPTGSTGDKAYIANWQANTYTVTADANGGSIPTTTGWTGTGNSATKTVTYDSQYGTLPEPTRTGYTFLGWNGKNLFNDTDLTYLINGIYTVKNNDESLSISGTPTVVWTNLTADRYRLLPGTYTMSTSEIKNYKICLKGKNVGESTYYEFCINPGEKSKTFTLEKEWRYYLYLNALNVNNYMEDTLYFQIQADSNIYNWEPYYIKSGTIVVQPNNHTLTAKWKPTDYEITYDLQGGSVATANPTSYNIESNTITLNNPTMTGYTFLGWTGSNGNTPQTTVTITKGSYGDKAYIANWQANSYTVTADANGGSIPTTTGWTGTGLTSTKSVTYDSQYGTLPTPTRDGYIFKGWNGKNKFNILNIESTNSNNWDVTIDNNSVLINHKNEYINGIPEIEFDSLLEGQYYLNGDNLDYIALYINDEYIRMVKTNQIIQINNNDKIKFTFHTPTNLVTEYSNIQLEEGTTATPWEPYYVTNTVNVTQSKDHTLKAIWEKKEATFLPGSEFNAKIKQLAGNSSPTNTSIDTNITSIVRSNSLDIMPVDDNVVSTSDSNTPIYAWFDSNSGTLYYYTDAVNLYMNKNANYMFYNLRNVNSIDLDDINTTKTTSMYALFHSCLNLSNLDLSDFNTENVQQMQSMFYNCSSLASIDLSSFDMSKVTYTSNMLDSMTLLKSLKTPSIYPTDSSVTITLPKLMVDSSDNEYTELNSSSPTETMLYTPATFIDGWKFNLRIKQLAGNQIETYGVDDNNITSIVRSNTLSITPTNANVVSTTDSYTPIYVWFDSNDGTIYYYTEAEHPYMNANAHSMFRQLVKVTSIDLGTINTSKATHMAAMFYASSSLTNLDLSTFDMSGITSSDRVASIFGTLTSLTSLKTPKVYPTDSSVKITLPKLMIDSNGNEYTELNSSSPTETMLYTPVTFLPGTEFNAKIKQLAGNEDATYQTADTNITSILRTNALPSGFTPTDDNIVSTSDSNTPIYAWFSNGTLYYYTDAVNFYMNNSATYMFYNLNNVTSIDIADINTSKTTSMNGLFHSCYKLSMLDVSNFNTSNVTTARSIFAYNRSLTSLDVSSFDLSSVNDMTYIFTGMTELKQLKTPKTYPVDSSITISLPKLMVDSSGNEYTTLNSSSPTETWLYTPATFLPGTEFNAKIKQLAGNENATYNTTDTNITSIVRSDTLGITPTDDNIVSTSDSNTPIYAWYDNGTIYYYTEEENPYMNTNASFMFYYLLNVTSIDISDVKTSNTNNMYSMFYNCRSLETIDVSNFNTSKVTNMSQMFAVNRALTTLDLSSFNTSNVTEMAAMFRYCNSLKELDLSKFDMTKVTNANLMITDLPVLESLKTPKVYPSEAVIQMPKTLYDPSGNAWTVLDSSAPTETWLHKMVCKRATTLHTETCSQTNDSLYCSGAGYTVGGSKNTRTITYGSLGTNASTLNSGDAFTCDVNGDGTFNELTERFYYVGDYYNTTTKEFETDTGVLVYYNNVSAGVANNTATSEYDTSGENWHGPVTAITQLPTTSQWTNIRLKNDSRAILSYNNGSMTDGGTLPNDFSYSGYSARLLTVQEINHSLNRSLSSLYSRLDDVAPYLFENTKYSTPTLNYRWWLETVSINNASAYSVMTTLSNSYNNGIYSHAVAIPTGLSIRPAIEVNKDFLNKKVNAYLITYDTNGGSENTTQTVTVGDSLGTLSVPTREGYTFAGWYTEASGGTQISTATVPTATTTYYAHWTPINYNITYDLDGGEVGTANPTTYNPDSNSITLNNPTKTGYTFAGWSGGKNLFNKDATPYYQNSWINESGGRNSEQYYSVYKIPIDENKEYTITHTHTVVNPCYAIFDENDTLLSVEKYSSRKTITFTSPANSKYILVSVITDPTFTPHYDKDIFQLEEGTNATSYEPYVSNETTLTIPSGSVGNRKYIANWTANTYTVTADANGGSIPTTTGWTGTGTTSTKSVTYDSQYGTLPTPTRNGYTFKGWNGKNLFDYQNTKNVTPGITADANGWITLDTTNNYLYYNYWTYNLDILEDTYYNIAFEIKEVENITYNYINVTSNSSGSGTGQFPLSQVLKSDLIPNTVKILRVKSNTNVNENNGLRTFYTNGNRNSNERMVFRISVYDDDDSITPSNFRYEPYYVTSSTNVTQDKNHTLKAKWEMNTYEITYDLQGGTLASSNPATYNVETNTFTLNNPTLTGQTFIGWTGSNGNTPEVNVTIPVGSYGDKAYVAHFSPIYEPETRIRSLNTIGTTIADDDPDSNLRFIGSNPSNYVSFNGQKWRIIGVFDGKLKIIGDSIGNYSWDTSRNTVNNGYGVNQWGPNNNGYTGADLMKLLNPGYSSNTDLKCNNTYSDGNCGTNDDSDYISGLVNNSLWWNAGSGYCYNYANYKTTECDFTTTGLQSNTARNMIDNATWYLGSNLASDNIWDGRMTASYLYNIERSNNTGKQCQGGNTCNDDVTRTATWQGKVGLLYPSDYIYATGGGTTHNRNTCLTVSSGYSEDNSVQNWDNTYTDCKNNNWIVDTSQWTWFISPRPTISYSYGVFFMYYTSSIRSNLAFAAGSVRPVVYLKSSVKLTSGDGSYNSPFNLIDTE